MIRNTVWDALHGRASDGPRRDVDVVYFDASDVADATTCASDAERSLTAALPSYRWEVVNQASVHVWQSAAVGHEVPPYRTLSAAIVSFPETATSVGIRLSSEDELDVVAPYGLDDLFGLVVRPGASAIDAAAFRARCREKAWQLNWPQLRVQSIASKHGDTGK